MWPHARSIPQAEILTVRRWYGGLNAVRRGATAASPADPATLITQAPDFVDEVPNLVDEVADFVDEVPNLVNEVPDFIDEVQTSLMKFQTSLMKSRTSLMKFQTSLMKSQTSFVKSPTSLGGCPLRPSDSEFWISGRESGKFYHPCYRNELFGGSSD